MTAPRYCSFCAKLPKEVALLIAGPTAFICDECVKYSATIVAEKLGSSRSSMPDEVAHVPSQAVQDAIEQSDNDPFYDWVASLPREPTPALREAYALYMASGIQTNHIKYMIWSNQHRAWWRPHSDGYTTNIAAAGHYTQHEAYDICELHDGVPDEIMVRVEDVTANLPNKDAP